MFGYPNPFPVRENEQPEKPPGLGGELITLTHGGRSECWWGRHAGFARIFPCMAQALSVQSYPGGQLDHRQPLRHDLGTNHETPLWPGQGVTSEDITRMDKQDSLPQRCHGTAGGSSCPTMTADVQAFVSSVGPGPVAFGLSPSQVFGSCEERGCLTTDELLQGSRRNPKMTSPYLYFRNQRRKHTTIWATAVRA